MSHFDRRIFCSQLESDPLEKKKWNRTEQFQETQEHLALQASGVLSA